MVGTTVDFETIVHPHQLAVEIANRFNTWNNLRQNKLKEWRELRDYLYATDTSTTTNALLPWSNTTTTPKLTQIADNLHANYMAALFPSRKWFKFEAGNLESNSQRKKESVQAYMENKVQQSKFKDTCAILVNDFIQTGNVFGGVEYVNDYKITEDGATVVQYSGPKLHRISPYDIVFNPTASDFTKTPKIIRSLITLGEIQRKVEKDPSNEHYRQVLGDMLYARATVKGSNHVDKSTGFVADGFSSIQQYYESDTVEVLKFYGDIYDMDSGILKTDMIITVVDRAYVLEEKENPSWQGHAPIYMAGWRKRPDNLYSMGPLDNLVGMQYRIDHLENLKADVFDQIAYPMLKIKGDVEDFDFAPGTKIYVGDEGDVGYLVPDATALNADFQIQTLENKMEEFAGAPRQAMGIRTPGEKTAFEVQTLQNSSARIFEHKAAQFESDFIEPVLNSMLEVARRNMDVVDTIKVVDEQSQLSSFREVKKEDIVSTGVLTPVGARHFAERARRVQSLTQLAQVKAQDPSISPHISGKELARILAEELGEEKLFGENIAVAESLETEQAVNNAQATNEESLISQLENGV